MAKKAQTKSEKKQERAYKRAVNATTKNMQKLSTLYNDTMLNIDSRISGPNILSKKELKDLDDIVKGVVTNEIDNIESFTGEDISRFLVSLFDDNGENNVGNKGYVESVDKLLKTENGDVINFFQERYKNRYYLYDDLKLVADEIFQLKDAILTYRDSIVTSDDISAEVAAKKEFMDMEEEDEQQALKKVEVMEEETKILNKIRSHVITKVLNYGEYFVYTLPYSAIFTKYQNSKEENKARGKVNDGNPLPYNTIGVKESTRFDDAVKSSSKPHGKEDNTNLELLTESSADFLHIKNKFVNSDCYGNKSNNELNTISKDILSDMNNIISHISVVDESCTDLILDSSIDDAYDYIKSKKVTKDFTPGKGNKNKAGFYADSLLDMTPGSDKVNEAEFDDEKGCYIKLIEPTKIIPITILNDAVVGYLYLYSDEVQMTATTKKGGIQNNQMTPSYMDNMVRGRQDLEKEMVAKIVNQVVKKFDKNWIKDNKKFKQVITDALIFDDLYRKDIQFQFIPAEYITHFKVNLDEDGNGISVIQDALFPAKLYLCLLLFKYLTIMNKSNDRNIYYVKNSGIEKDIAKQTQNVIRQVKKKQMTITDLMNTQVMNSKLGANKDIFMAVGQSDTRPVDIDILSGQDVQLDTPLMEELKKQFLNATGVPSVLQEYMDQADYAKTLVMANAKFVGRVISLQAELNPSITELYKKLLKFCTDLSPETIHQFKFTFSTPKDVNLVNTSDRIASVESTTQLMMDAKYGREHEEPSEEYKRVKDYVYGALLKENFPNLPWNLMEEAEKKFKVTAVRLEEEKKLKENQAMDNGGGEQY